MKTTKAPSTSSGEPTYWQRIFLQSKVNGAAYYGDELPGYRWNWPKETYLQRRLRYSRWQAMVESPR